MEEDSVKFTVDPYVSGRATFEDLERGLYVSVRAKKGRHYLVMKFMCEDGGFIVGDRVDDLNWDEAVKFAEETVESVVDCCTSKVFPTGFVNSKKILKGGCSWNVRDENDSNLAMITSSTEGERFRLYVGKRGRMEITQIAGFSCREDEESLSRGEQVARFIFRIMCKCFKHEGDPIPKLMDGELLHNCNFNFSMRPKGQSVVVLN